MFKEKPQDRVGDCNGKEKVPTTGMSDRNVHSTKSKVSHITLDYDSRKFD